MVEVWVERPLVGCCTAHEEHVSTLLRQQVGDAIVASHPVAVVPLRFLAGRRIERIVPSDGYPVRPFIAIEIDSPVASGGKGTDNCRFSGPRHTGDEYPLHASTVPESTRRVPESR